MEIKNKQKKYKSNYNLVYSCQFHVIFTPKYRRKILTDSIATRLKELIYEKQEEYDFEVLDIEVMPDHVHLLIDTNPKIGVFKTIGRLKGFTAKILRQEFPELKSRLPCLWTRSQFISSVGSVSLATVKKYIEDQKNK